MLTDNLNVSTLMLILTGDTAGAIEAADEGYEVALSVGNVWNQMAIKANISPAYRSAVTTIELSRISRISSV